MPVILGARECARKGLGKPSLPQQGVWGKVPPEKNIVLKNKLRRIYITSTKLPLFLNFLLQLIVNPPSFKRLLTTLANCSLFSNSLCAIYSFMYCPIGYDLDRNLNPYDSAISLAMKRLIEEDLYWVVLYSRWCEPGNWELTKKEFFGGFPPVLKQIITFFARRQAVKNLYGQGIGRHSREEIYQIGIKDLMAICHFLADKPFLMGNEPTSVDASAYGLLANILWTPTESPINS